MKNYLNFETDIKNLEEELDKLKEPYNQEGLSEVDTEKISKIQSEIDGKLSEVYSNCLLYTSPRPRDGLLSRLPSSA